MPRNSVFAIFVAALSCGAFLGQDAKTTTNTELLQQVNQAFSQGRSIQSLQLQGTAHIYMGSHDETGAAEITVDMNGSTSMTLHLEKGLRTESKSVTQSSHSCSWSREDGIAHSTMLNNCWTSVPWLLPSLALQSTQFPGELSVLDVGLQQFNGQSVHALKAQIASAPSTIPSAVAATMVKQSQATIYVDETSHLPTGLTYSLLGEGRIVRPVSVEIRYSAYQLFSGVAVPTHIERRINGALQLAIDISQVNQKSE